MTNLRRMRVEPLEDRRLLALTVTTEFDVIDPSDGYTSLREAIVQASANDTINFDISSPLVFLDGGGDLIVDKPLTIEGPGSAQLTLIRVGSAVRHFRVDDGNSAAEAAVKLVGMTLAGAEMNGSGAAIHSAESLTLIDVVVRENRATGDGGGIWSSGALNLVDTVIENNRASGSGGGLWAGGALSIQGGKIESNHAGVDGGAVWVQGPAEVVEADVRGNSAADDGGGLLSLGHTTIQNSTLASNHAGGDGGALWGESRLEVLSSTLYGNDAVGRGGGLYIGSGTADIRNATISGNRVSGEYGSGGGVFARSAISLSSSTVTLNSAVKSTGTAGGMWTSNSPVEIANSIIAKNSAGWQHGDLRLGTGAWAISHSLLGDCGSLTQQQLTAVISGGSLIDVDPQLGPLAFNGGDRLTHVPLVGSPAIDLGGVTELSFDQRGVPYYRVSDGNADGVAKLDAGAVELQARTFIVDTKDDEMDGNYLPGDLSLREAVFLANQESGAQPVLVAFANQLNGETLQLSVPLGHISISRAVTVDAGALTSGVTVDAGHGLDGVPRTGDGTRIFYVEAGADAELINLTLTGGDIVGELNNGGGAILSKGMVTVKGCRIEENATIGVQSAGGGIAGNVWLNDSVVARNATTGAEAHGGGALILIGGVSNSSIVGNVTYGERSAGGGLWVKYPNPQRGGPSFQIVDSTISGNMTTGGSQAHGGGVYFHNHQSHNRLQIFRSTLSGNSATGNGGGLFAAYYDRYFSSVSLHETVVADNTAGGKGGGIFTGAGSVTLVASVIDNNTSGGKGAGIYTSGGGTVERSTIVGNHGTGLHSENHRWGGPLEVVDSLIVDNVRGIDFYSARYANFTLTNSTVSGNSEVGVAIENDLMVPSFVRSSTICNNNIGVWSKNYDNIYVYSSVVTGNSGGALVCSESEFFTIRSHFSLIDSNAGTPFVEAPLGAPDDFGNIIGGPIHGIVDPRLGPLADNGGPTWTHALLPGSPAINAGDPPTAPTQFDQRGGPYVRVYDGRIDMGAYEFQPRVPAGDFDADGDVDGKDLMLWQRNPRIHSIGDWQDGYRSALSVARAEWHESQELRVESQEPEGVAEVELRNLESGFRMVPAPPAEAGSPGATSSPEAILEDSYIAQVDRAMEQWSASTTLPGTPAGAAFGEMVARRDFKRIASAR